MPNRVGMTIVCPMCGVAVGVMCKSIRSKGYRELAMVHTSRARAAKDMRITNYILKKDGAK